MESLAQSLEAEVGPDRVRLAYMDHTPPSLDDVVSEAAQAGLARVRVLPLFIADEGHVDRDIRPVVERLRGSHRSVEVELLPALGGHESFREFLAKIALEEPESNA